MNVRRALHSDLDAVLAVEGKWSTTPHWTRKQFEAELDDSNSIFLVADGGFLVARRYPHELQLLDVAVGELRKGVGRALLTSLMRENLRPITLEVSDKNPGAQAFYEAQGFRVVGRRPKFYNDGSDAVLMDLS